MEREEKSLLDALPTGARLLGGREEEARAEWERLESQHRIHADSEYDEPLFTLEQNGVGFAPLGNIMALAAEMKHGKTFLLTAFAGAMLRGRFMGLTAKVENASVVYFDTEQDLCDGQRIQRRVHWMAGWDFRTDNPRFRIYHLREIPCEGRRAFIGATLRNLRPTVAIIDGVRDLLQDFNDLAESAGLIQEMMTLSSECRCALWTVLHVNPNSDKMRGHLGTELGNKVTDVFRVRKERPKGLDHPVFSVEQVAARHRDVDGWTFRINDGLPYGIPELEDGQRADQQEEDRKKELRQLLGQYIPTPGGTTKTALQKDLKEGQGFGSGKSWKIITEALTLGVLEQHKMNGKIYIIGEIPMAESTQTEAPF